MCLCVLVTQLCSPPGSSAHGILQARILEWVAIHFSRGLSQPRDRTRVSSIEDRFFTIWATSLWRYLSFILKGKWFIKKKSKTNIKQTKPKDKQKNLPNGPLYIRKYWWGKPQGLVKSAFLSLLRCNGPCSRQVHEIIMISCLIL